jgi:mRNA-degrading endonuclease toxin of MazEF toxin-antitoxin module
MNRGEIWLVRLDPTVGTEISKTHPVVIVNDNAIGILPLKVIVAASPETAVTAYRQPREPLADPERKFPAEPGRLTEAVD